MPSLLHRRLVIATANQHKTEEFRALLGSGWRVEDLRDHPHLAAPEENGSTFSENAAIKALAASCALDADCLVIADDSGLEVDALGGRPGVHSARFAGPGATDAANREKLLRELAGAGARGGRTRTARFRCVLAAARNGRVLAEFDGAVEGVIGTVEKGAGGFGYDSLFIPDGHCATFAQLPAEVKNAMSHRGRAAAKLKEWLQTQAPPEG
jgi:XTP/dITP diphosphohydrolase